jgi:hypothetical protein
MVFLPNVGVNLRPCLCGVVNYASAQALDFLELGQKSTFLDWKHHKVPFFVYIQLWTGTSSFIQSTCCKKNEGCSKSQIPLIEDCQLNI